MVDRIDMLTDVRDILIASAEPEFANSLKHPVSDIEFGLRVPEDIIGMDQNTGILIALISAPRNPDSMGKSETYMKMQFMVFIRGTDAEDDYLECTRLAQAVERELEKDANRNLPVSAARFEMFSAFDYDAYANEDFYLHVTLVVAEYWVTD